MADCVCCTLVVSPIFWVRIWQTLWPSLILCLRWDSSRACVWIRELYFLWSEEENVVEHQVRQI